MLGDQRVDQITARAIDRLTTKLQSGEVSRRPLSHNSVANILGLLRRMLNVAKRWSYIDEVPEICTLKKKPERLEDDKWLTQEETTALLEATEPEWLAVVTVAVRTGLRVGELQGLRWSDVDLEGERLVVQRSWSEILQEPGPPKGGRPREVPLTWDALAALRPIRGKRRDDAFIFGDAYIPFHQDELRRALGRARRSSGLTKHLHIHMLRHTWASHCILRGVHSRVVMMWGGWTSEAMLARYAHLAPREVESLIQRIAPKRRDLRIVPPVPKVGHRLGTAGGGGSKTAR
ncbi:MAG: site-specific integrase [Myxococcota bacterium]